MGRRAGLQAALGSLLLALSALPAAAQQQQQQGAQTQDPSIVVTQQRLTREAVGGFVDNVTVLADGQIARFHQPVCPVSIGLPDSYNRIIEQRIRKVAADAGIPTEGANCKPNLVVMIADDAGAVTKALIAKYPAVLIDPESPEMASLLRETGPARAWQVLERRGADGRVIDSGSFMADAPVVRTNVHSRVKKTLRTDIGLSFVVLTFAAIEGLNLRQIADYAAMRGLARTQVRAQEGPTILGLLDLPVAERSKIRGLTPLDAAYLKALYRTDNTVAAQSQKAAMATAIEQELQ